MSRLTQLINPEVIHTSGRLSLAVGQYPPRKQLLSVVKGCLLMRLSDDGWKTLEV